MEEPLVKDPLYYQFWEPFLVVVALRRQKAFDQQRFRSLYYLWYSLHSGQQITPVPDLVQRETFIKSV